MSYVFSHLLTFRCRPSTMPALQSTYSICHTVHAVSMCMLPRTPHLQVIDTIGKEVNMRQETVDFLKLLVDTNRIDCITEIIDMFETKYNEITDTQVRVIQAAPLMHALLTVSATCTCCLTFG